jgi:hypothetical protein
MGKIFELLLMGLAMLPRDDHEYACTKCGMKRGGGFCDRSHFGEVGACNFVRTEEVRPQEGR